MRCAAERDRLCAKRRWRTFFLSSVRTTIGSPSASASGTLPCACGHVIFAAEQCRRRLDPGGLAPGWISTSMSSRRCAPLYMTWLLVRRPRRRNSGQSDPYPEVRVRASTRLGNWPAADLDCCLTDDAVTCHKGKLIGVRPRAYRWAGHTHTFDFSTAGSSLTAPVVSGCRA